MMRYVSLEPLRLFLKLAQLWRSSPPLLLMTSLQVTSRIEHCEGTSITYQGAELTNHDQGIDYVKSHKDEYLANIQSCLKS